MAKRILLAFGLIVAGIVLTNTVYRSFIIPRLDSWHVIPLRWYAPIIVPIALGAVGAGLVVRSWMDIASVAVLVAMLSFLPGGHDVEFGMSFIVGLAMTAVSLSLVFVLARHFLHRSAPI